MPLSQCLEMQISGIPACLDSSDTCLVRLTLTDNVSEPLHPCSGETKSSDAQQKSHNRSQPPLNAAVTIEMKCHAICHANKFNIPY